MIVGQLTLDLDAAMRDQDDLETRIRAAVVEDDMSPAETEAAVEDAYARLGITRPPDAAPAAPCICERPMLFAAELGEGSCGLCGREPRR